LAQQLKPHGVVPASQQQPAAPDVKVQVPEQQLDAHCVVPAGQPHVPAEASRQATPAAQQFGPHGVSPALHVASARNGFSTTAATPAAAAAPSIFRAPRRGMGSAIDRERSSNRPLMRCSSRPPALSSTRER
jgi:hypothetical protein